MRKKTSNKIIAYEPDGVRFFDNAKLAAAHYGINLTILYSHINRGNMSKEGVFFDYQIDESINPNSDE